MLVRTLLLVSVTSIAAADAPDQARLTIGEEVYNIPVGKSFAVRLGGERVTMRLDFATEHEFRQEGVAFRYPTALRAEAPTGREGAAVWTLQGQSAAILVQRYEAGLDPKSLAAVLVENLVAREGTLAGEPQPVKLTVGDRSYAGTQLRSERPAKDGAPATESVENVFTFASGKGVFALLVQDVHPAGDKESAEYAEALRLLSESLETAEPRTKSLEPRTK